MASTYTTNLGLEKPNGNDDISVLAINGNSDILDKHSIGTAFGSGQTNLSETLKNCTGTIAEHLKYHMNGNLIIIEGRVIINNYVRTGGNPGFTVTLPSGKKSKYAVSILCAGFNGTSKSGKNFRFGECTRLYTSANSTTLTIDTTETIDNMASADKTVFQVAPIILEVI